jgi:N-acetylglutamate synthase-like GNAT family acetyltransferase
MKIFKATIKDLQDINRLNDKYFKEIRDFKEIIEGSHDYFYVGVENGKIIGFSGFHYYAWNNSASVIDIFVHPDFRKNGHGTKLIKKIIKEAKAIKARVIMAEAPSLSNALIAYLKNGFRVCGFNDRYYNNTGKEIAMFLSKDLN